MKIVKNWENFNENFIDDAVPYETELRKKIKSSEEFFTTGP